MSNIDRPNPEPPVLPWIGGGIGLGVASGIAAFMISQSLALAALAGAIVILCLSLGWWAGIWANGNFNNERDPGAKEQPVVANLPVRQGEQDAQASVLFARSAIEATPNPVLIIDRLGRIVTTNQAARTRFSINSELARFNGVVRRPDIIDAVEAVLRDGEARTLNIETRVPVDRYERFSIAAFEVASVSYVLIAVLDDTEARISEQMRADFLANASHELRTPLAAIIGFIETLRGPARDDTVARAKFLEVMHLQADRMSRLISDLLSLSRIELNERVPPTENTDIVATALEAADILTPEKKKRLVLDFVNQPVWVLGDRDEMAQVMLNLIDNALKYSHPDSKVRIQIKSGFDREAATSVAMRQWANAARLPLTSPEVERDRSYGVIRVENEGEGIDRQHLPRLSERFFRVEDSASGKSGTGLGLAIVKHIVSRHRGGLLVESELGRGAAFSVYLPQPFSLPTSNDTQLNSVQAKLDPSRANKSISAK